MQLREKAAQIVPDFSWEAVDRVFLDMDGTLLDKYYDDYFWGEHVPLTYAGKNHVDVVAAQDLLYRIYKSVENTLQWTNLDYWSEQLGLDIVAMKREISHLINAHPSITDFFAYMHKIDKPLYLITNADPQSLALKMEQVQLHGWFKQIVCSSEVGLAKEQPEFWPRLARLLGYDKERTLFADDTEQVLHSAATYGIRHLIHIAKPSSRLPVRFSARYQSIATFAELIF